MMGRENVHTFETYSLAGNHCSCVDLGSEHCPCHLALTGDCLVCSRLQGKDTCDCDWDGACPYTVFIQNGNRVSDFRGELAAPLVRKKEYSDQVTVLILRVGRGFAQNASRPGSFVFLRRAGGQKEDCDARLADPERRGMLGDVHYYDIPVSVLKADETRGEIHLAIRREGPKSKALLDGVGASGEDDAFGGPEVARLDYIVRGPYHNGLHGSEYLRPARIRGKRILFITKGIGAASAILAMEQRKPLLGSQEEAGANEQPVTEIHWLADDEKVGRELLEEYGGDGAVCGRIGMESSSHRTVTPEYITLAGPRREARLMEGKLPEGRLREVLREGRFDVVGIMASDYYVALLKELVQRELPEAKLVWNNNAVMCCGEGICGACIKLGPDGTPVRTCKCRIG